MKRTAQSIEERKASVSSEGRRENENKPAKNRKDSETRGQEATARKSGIGRGNHPNSRKALRPAPPWPKGVSGNPGGLPGTDLAGQYARRFFEKHEDKGISPEMSQDLKGFNAYAFGVLADRGYGKVKETHEVVGEEGGPVEIVVKLIKA